MTLDPLPVETAENPESLPAFQAFRVAAVGRPERSMGDSVIPAEPPRWSEVREHARELAAHPAHLEVLTTLARAGLALDGLDGLASALGTLADAFERDWATMFPAPDEDDPDEPWYERTNLLADLAADTSFTDALARTPLVAVRGIGAFSARDLEIAEGTVEGSEEERARCRSGPIDAAFAQAELDALASTGTALDTAGAAAGRAVAALERETGAGGGRALTEIAARVDAIRTRFASRAAGRLGAEALEAPAANDAAAAPSAVPDEATGVEDVAAPAAAPALADHDAVRDALGAVVAYYVRHEPGSPVAVLVARTRSLVGSGFFELLGTLCPEGDAGGDFAARLAAPRRDPLVTLLNDGFGGHLAGNGAPLPSGQDEESTPGRAVTTREAVVATLDDVLAFYRVREPSSPVPLVLARVRTLVPLDFDGVLDALRRALAADATAAAAARNGDA